MSNIIDLTATELKDAFRAYKTLLEGSAADVERHNSRVQEDLENLDETGTPPPSYKKNIQNLLASTEEYTAHLGQLAGLHEKLSGFFLDDEAANELKKVVDQGYDHATDLAKLIIQLPKEKDRLTFAENLERVHEKMSLLAQEKLEDVKRRSKLIDRTGNRLATPEDVKQTSWEGEKSEAEFKLSLVQPQLEKALEDFNSTSDRMVTDKDILLHHQVMHGDITMDETLPTDLKRLVDQAHDLELSIKTADNELARIPDERAIRSFLENLYPEKKVADAQLLQAKLSKNENSSKAATEGLKAAYAAVDEKLDAEEQEAKKLFADELADDEVLQAARQNNDIKQRLSRERELRSESIVYKNINRLKKMRDLLLSDKNDLLSEEINLNFDESIAINARVSGAAGKVELGDDISTQNADAEADEALAELILTNPAAAKSAALPWTRRSDSGRHSKIKDIAVENISPEAKQAVLREESARGASTKNDTDTTPTPTKPFDVDQLQRLIDQKDQESLN